MSRMTRLMLVLALALVLAPFGALRAQETPPDPTRFGVGFQFTFPAFGLNLTADLSQRVAAQGIIGAFGDLRTYAGRGIYRFSRKPYSSAYGYGMLGAWSYKGLEFVDEDDPWNWDLRETTETVFGMGAGVGVEYDWRGMNRNLPAVAWNLEIGISRIDFQDVDFDFSALMIGTGAQYRF